MKAFLLLFIANFIAFASNASFKKDSVLHNVPLVGQLTESWCWVASIKMALDYKQPENDYDQCEIADKANEFFVPIKTEKCDCKTHIKPYANNISYPISLKKFLKACPRKLNGISSIGLNGNKEQMEKDLDSNIITIAKVLNKINGQNYKYYNLEKFYSIPDSIRAKKIAIALVENKIATGGTSIHVVVICGLKIDDNSGLNLFINDPEKKLNFLQRRKKAQVSRYLVNFNEKGESAKYNIKRFIFI